MQSKLYISNTSHLKNPVCYEKVVNALPAYRRDKLSAFKANNARYLSVLAGALLCEALKDADIDPYALKMAEGENKKPYFTNRPDIHFSLSHSGEYALCLISDAECGCDIEQIKAYKPEIANRFFHTDEKLYLSSINDPDIQKDAFYRIWTLKESFLKITGEGMRLPLDSFQIDISGESPIVIQNINDIKYKAVEFTCQMGYAISAILSPQSTLPQILYKEIQ